MDAQNKYQKILNSAISYPAYRSSTVSLIHSQVVDSNGHPVVISGLYNEEKAPNQILEYAQTLLEQASEKNIAIKVAIHSGKFEKDINVEHLKNWSLPGTN